MSRTRFSEPPRRYRVTTWAIRGRGEAAVGEGGEGAERFSAPADRSASREIVEAIARRYERSPCITCAERRSARSRGTSSEAQPRLRRSDEPPGRACACEPGVRQGREGLVPRVTSTFRCEHHGPRPSVT